CRPQQLAAPDPGGIGHQRLRRLQIRMGLQEGLDLRRFSTSCHDHVPFRGVLAAQKPAGRNLAKRWAIGYRSRLPLFGRRGIRSMSASASTNYRSIPRAAIAELFRRETARFAEVNPRSKALAERAKDHLPNAVPMHWMTDWRTPFPLFVASA